MEGHHKTELKIHPVGQPCTLHVVYYNTVVVNCHTLRTVNERYVKNLLNMNISQWKWSLNMTCKLWCTILVHAENKNNSHSQHGIKSTCCHLILNILTWHIWHFLFHFRTALSQRCQVCETVKLTGLHTFKPLVFLLIYCFTIAFLKSYFPWLQNWNIHVVYLWRC